MVKCTSVTPRCLHTGIYTYTTVGVIGTRLHHFVKRLLLSQILFKKHNFFQMFWKIHLSSTVLTICTMKYWVRVIVSRPWSCSLLQVIQTSTHKLPWTLCLSVVKEHAWSLFLYNSYCRVFYAWFCQYCHIVPSYCLFVA